MTFVNFPVAALALTLVLAAGCAREQDHPPGTPVEAQDDLGRLVRLPRPAERIVSLAPSLTETLFALGADSAVVGVTSVCNYPPEARRRTVVGGMTNPSLERIASLNPDLVVLTVLGNNRSDFEKLEQLRLPVFVSNPSDFGGILRSIRSLAALTGRNAQGEALRDSLDGRRAALTERAEQLPRASMLLLVSTRPLIAASPGTFLDELLQFAHGVNALPPSRVPFPIVGPEEILRARPEWILATTDAASDPDELLEALPQLRSLPALKNRQVLLLDADLISRPGPRILQALERIVERLEAHQRSSPSSRTRTPPSHR